MKCIDLKTSCVLILITFLHSSRSTNSSSSSEETSHFNGTYNETGILVIETNVTQNHSSEDILTERLNRKSTWMGETMDPVTVKVLCDLVRYEVATSKAHTPSFVFASVKHPPLYQYGDYDIDCLKWISIPCQGVPSGVFDPDCQFWLPKRDLSIEGCEKIAGVLQNNETNYTDYSGENRGRRTKRSIPLAITGLNALQLCTATNEFIGHEVVFDTVTLKTDEPSDWRCISWQSSYDGIWRKQRIPDTECEKLNEYRYVEPMMNNLDNNPGQTDLECMGASGLVACTFVHK